ncbi:MAG: heme A synthase, partial [Pseudomonadota bacterium]
HAGQTAPTASKQKAKPREARTAIARWLMVLFALVVLMISVGGMTRLTDSGLSITEWRPVTGALPPLSAEAWDAEFAKYKEIPEYQLQNKGMSLAEFKVIYWWEWGHRQLGRVIGLVWALGFFAFLALSKIPRGWTMPLLGLGLLGGLQGAIGWWMVSSGLTGTMLDVASYRLATHLGLAFIILGLIAWFVPRIQLAEVDALQARRRREGGAMALATLLLAAAFLQILLGALVAGIDAGRSYTDWPLMGGAIFPATAWDLTPAWKNFFENAGLVQFNHRITGYILFLLALVVWWRGASSAVRAVRSAFHWMMWFLTLQIVLGVVTVIYAAPWYLGIAHQLLGVAVFVAIIRARFRAAYPPEERVARA